MKIKQLLLLIVLLLILNGCGKKGPVQPIDTKVTAPESSAPASQTQTKNCAN